MAGITLALNGDDFGSVYVWDEKTAQFTLTNQTGATINFKAEVTKGRFHLVSAGSGSLEDKKSCEITISFSPDVEGTFDGTLSTVVGTDRTTLNLKGIGISPLEFSKGSIKFGFVATNSTLVETVVLTNNSSQDVNFALEVPAGAYTIMPPLPKTLPAKTPVDLQIAFTPPGDKQYQDSLRAVRTPNAGEKPSRDNPSVGFLGHGGGILFSPGLAPASYNIELVFATVRIGETATLPLKLTNTNKSMTHKVTIGQTISAPISCDNPGNPLIKQIPPGQNLELLFTFAPLAQKKYGPKDQELSVEGEAVPRGTVVCSLEGVCLDRQILFGNVTVGQMGKATIDVRNLRDESAAVRLSTSKPFSVDPDNFVLKPNETKNDIEVYFSPTANNVFAGTLVVVTKLSQSGTVITEHITLGGFGVK